MPAGSRRIGKRQRKRPPLLVAASPAGSGESVATLLAALDETSFGIIVLDRSGRMISSNAAAGRVLQARDAILEHEGRLLVASPNAQAALNETVAWATGHTGDANSSGMRALHRSGRPPIIILPLPLTNSAVVEMRGALLLYDAEAQDTLSSAHLRQLYNLTRAESALCNALLDGVSLNTFAADRGVSPNTVRTLLSRTFAKTGMKRQSDLVRMLTSLAGLQALQTGFAAGIAANQPGCAPQHRPFRGKLKLDILARADLDRFPDLQASVTFGEYAPGGTNKRHAHLDCLELIFVMEGAISTDIEGEGTRLTQAGEVLCLKPDIFHQGRNASETAPAKLVIVKLKRRGAATTILSH